MKSWFPALLLASSLTITCPLVQAQELPRRVFLGIGLQGINDSIQRRYQLPDRQGVLVREVRPQSSAQAAGLQPGDVVVQVGKKDVSGNVGEFVATLKQFRAGEKVSFTLLRQGRKMRKEVVFKPFPQESSPLYDVQYASVKAGPNQLRTIITRPRRATGPLPMVLFIQGVGCFSIDNPLAPDDPTNRIIDSLSRHGYATMRVDKTGMGDSRGTPCPESDFQMEASGYKAGLAAIKQLNFVDQHNIFLAGFSIGGIMAPLVAEGEPIKGIVVYGTASRNFIEYQLQNLRRQSELSGLAYDSITDRLKLAAAALHLLLTEKQTPEQVLARYPQAASLINFPQNYRYMQQWEAANLAAAWKKLDTNVLALRGESDFISYNEDHYLIENIVNREHPGKATFVQLKEVDHFFTRARSMQESMQLADSPQAAKNFEFMSVILRWLADKRAV
jgi:alpha-beta hydrolase superfamily lysophospholipase